MFLLLGTRAVLRLLATVRFSCPSCGVDARQEVYEEANKFTVFFLPLFTLSRRHLNRCTNCGFETALTAEQARRSMDWAAHNA